MLYTLMAFKPKERADYGMNERNDQSLSVIIILNEHSFFLELWNILGEPCEISKTCQLAAHHDHTYNYTKIYTRTQDPSWPKAIFNRGTSFFHVCGMSSIPSWMPSQSQRPFLFFSFWTILPVLPLASPSLITQGWCSPGLPSMLKCSYLVVIWIPRAIPSGFACLVYPRR